MDIAVTLVQAYLRVNGYFTVAEYPVLEVAEPGGYRTTTDLDLLAFRFPGAGRLVPRGRTGAHEEWIFEPDPALGCPSEVPDMLIGEVKEGKAVLNPATRNPDVLRTALARFGCCSPKHAGDVVRTLLRKGRAQTPEGHQVRLVAFGAVADGHERVSTTIELAHVARFLREFLREHWDLLHHAQFKDPALAFLMMMEKAAAGT